MNRALLILVTAIIASCSSEAPTDPVYHVDGIALNGYDPVAYFEQAEPRKGTELESLEYEGHTYLFTNSKNKVLFEADPEKYLPQYGGWCVYAIAASSTRMQPDPTLWQIQGGELQLFYDDWTSSFTGNLKDEWNSDSTGFSQKAEANWQKMN